MDVNNSNKKKYFTKNSKYDTIELNKTRSKKVICYELYFNEDSSPCNGVKNLSIIVYKKRLKTRNNHTFNTYHPATISSDKSKHRTVIARSSSMPDITQNTNYTGMERSSPNEIRLKANKSILNSKVTVNLVNEHRNGQHINHLNFLMQCNWKVYRCELSTGQEKCCCSCNSDVLYEVMKSLYNCYKRKNCEDCDCILCSHICKEDKFKAKARKSAIAAKRREKIREITKHEKKEVAKPAEEEPPKRKKEEPPKPEKEAPPKTEKEAPPKPTKPEKVQVSPKPPKPEKVQVPPKPPKTKKEIPPKPEKVQVPKLEKEVSPKPPKPEKVQVPKLEKEVPPKPPKPEKVQVPKLKKEVPPKPLIPKKEISPKPEKETSPTPKKVVPPLRKAPSEKGLSKRKAPVERIKAKSAGAIPHIKTPSLTEVRKKRSLPPKTKPIKIPPKKLKKAKAAGLLTPLEGKTPAEKKKIIKGLAEAGLPLPEPKTSSDMLLMQIVMKDQLPPPLPAPKKTPSEEAVPIKKHKKRRLPSEESIPPAKLKKAKAAGLLTPLEGKTPAEKKKIIKGLAEAGLPLPEPKTSSDMLLMQIVMKDQLPPPLPAPKKTPSEEAVPIKKHKKRRPPSEESIPPAKLKKAKAAGLLTPLEGKTPAEKKKIIKGLAEAGLPLPEPKTSSDMLLMQIVMKDQLPPPPSVPKKARSEETVPIKKRKIRRPPSEESVEIPPEKLKKAKAAGLLTPLEGKTPAEKEKIVRGLAQAGLPLPKPKTKADKLMIQLIKQEVGAPPSPKVSSVRLKKPKRPTPEPSEETLPRRKRKKRRPPSEESVEIPPEKLKKAKAAGLMTPLEGKTPAEKEKIVRGLAQAGLPLPEPKTKDDKLMIQLIKQEVGAPPPPTVSSVKLKKSKRPTPEPSEETIPRRKRKKRRIPSEESIEIPPEKLKKAKAAGLLTPLEGKTPAEKEKIVRGLAQAGLPLPKPKTKDDKLMIQLIKQEVGAPPPPKVSSVKLKKPKRPTPEPSEETIPRRKKRKKPKVPSETESVTSPKVSPEKLKKAKAAGLLTPLEGKTREEKEHIIKGLAEAGVPLPEAKTSSDMMLLQVLMNDLIQQAPPPPRPKKQPSEEALPPKRRKKREALSEASEESIPRRKRKKQKIPSEKLKIAKAAGLLTPLEGKPPAEKEKIIRGLAEAGLPLPKAKTASDKMLLQLIRQELGIPLPPRTPSVKSKKVKVAKPEPSEETVRKRKHKKRRLPTETESLEIPPEKLKNAKAAGLLTPLQGKPRAEKERIIRGLAEARIPLPKPKTPSDKMLIQTIRQELGLPLPKTASSVQLKKAKPALLAPSEKSLPTKVRKERGIPREIETYRVPSEKIKRAQAAGLLTPLEGKTPAEKEKIIRGLADAGLPLPKPKTSSDRMLIQTIRQEQRIPPIGRIPSEKSIIRKAKAEGLFTPITGKSPARKEKILRGLASAGLPLPDGKTASDKDLIRKVRVKAGLPPEATPSEKMGKIKKVAKEPETFKPKNVHSDKLQKAKAVGLLTPLEGKSPKEKDKIMRGLADLGLPLPEAKTPSVKALSDKIRKERGLPPEPKTPSMKIKHEKAATTGLLVPLEGLSSKEKERVLKGQAKLGIPLPEGRTKSEKSVIAKVKADIASTQASPEKVKKGLVTPLEGKTPAEKEKIIRGLAEAGLPLPEATTSSDMFLLEIIRTELGIPPPATTPSEKSIVRKAKAEGLFTPITGKTPAEKERILRGLANAGLPLPVGKTASDKALIKKIRAEAGLSLEPTRSEKMGKIRKKSKGMGAKELATEQQIKDMEGHKCERACGCDMKKIRFKHSYVKIKVTSLDLSSLCSCSHECHCCDQQAKNDVSIDEEGINVTVGRVIAPPVFKSTLNYSTEFSRAFSNNIDTSPTEDVEKYLDKTLQMVTYRSKKQIEKKSSSSNSQKSEKLSLEREVPTFKGLKSKSDKNLQDRDKNIRAYLLLNCTTSIRSVSTTSSLGSIYLIKSGSTLSSNTNSNRSTATRFCDSLLTASNLSLNLIETSTSSELGNNKFSKHVKASNSDSGRYFWKRQEMSRSALWNQNEFNVFRVSRVTIATEANTKEMKLMCKENESISVIYKRSCEFDLEAMLDKLLLRKQTFDSSSSMFLSVSTSDESDCDISDETSLSDFNETG